MKKLKRQKLKRGNLGTMTMAKPVALIAGGTGCAKRRMGSTDVKSAIGFPKTMLIVQ
jgi:hypothetical protein